ncbi:MFS transporter [Micromonospora polyrhachis]
MWLAALFLLAFSFGTDDMIIAGILPEIAADLRVSVAASGQLVTVFALTYALAAPVAALLTARLPRRAVLVGAAAVFVVANLGAALAPTYGLLLVVRIVAALAAATASPAAFAVAATAAPAGRQGRYLAIVSAGLTTSLVAGVPIGTWLGGTFGWRTTMVFVAAVAVVAGLGLLTSLPELPGVPPGSLRARLVPLRRPGTALALVAMVPSGAGGMMSYVYVSEVAGRLGNVSGSSLALLITAIGLAGIGGALLGGRAVDVFGPRRAMLIFLAGMLAAPVVMLGLGLGRTGSPYPFVVMVVTFAGYGLATWGISPATQAWLLHGDGGSAANELIALNNSFMFLGFSVAGGLGGLALTVGGPLAVPAAATGCLVVALSLFAIAFRLERKRGRRDRKGR